MAIYMQAYPQGRCCRPTQGSQYVIWPASSSTHRRRGWHHLYNIFVRSGWSNRIAQRTYTPVNMILCNKPDCCDGELYCLEICLLVIAIKLYDLSNVCILQSNIVRTQIVLPRCMFAIHARSAISLVQPVILKIRSTHKNVTLMKPDPPSVGGGAGKPDYSVW